MPNVMRGEVWQIDFAHDFREDFQARGYSFLLPPTAADSVSSRFTSQRILSPGHQTFSRTAKQPAQNLPQISASRPLFLAQALRTVILQFVLKKQIQ